MKMVTASDRNRNHGIGGSNCWRWSILVTSSYRTLSLMGFSHGSWPVLMRAMMHAALTWKVKKGMTSESSNYRLWRHNTGRWHIAS